MEPAHIPHHKREQGLPVGLAGHLKVTLLPVGDLAAYRAKTTLDAQPDAVPVGFGTTTKLLPARNKKRTRKWTLFTLWFNTYRCVLLLTTSRLACVSDCPSCLCSLENFSLLWSP
jgi:hypothetical protein